jgi:hypothetical protein
MFGEVRYIFNPSIPLHARRSGSYAPVRKTERFKAYARKAPRPTLLRQFEYVSHQLPWQYEFDHNRH